MANNNINPSIPIFKGHGYEAWSTKMRTLFISQELWQFVEKEQAESAEIRKKDAMALYFIQQAVDETIFLRIKTATKAKEAWDVLQKRYQGNSKSKEKRPIMDSEDEAQIKKLKDDLSRELNNLESRLSANSCIYRVPKRLREVNELAYTPRLVSIGPLHCRNENLIQMETQKVRSLNNFISRGINGEKMGKIITLIQKEEENIRNCYAEKIDYLDSDSFIKMVLLDAIFIIELFQNGEMTNDAVFVRKEDIDKDLILLENQLPFFILEHIYNTAFNIAVVTCPDAKTFKTLTLDYFKSKNKQEKLFPQDQDVKHFTDLLRYFLLPDEPRSLQESKWCTEKCLQYIRWPEATDPKKRSQVYSATELHESGVKFELREKKCLLNIEFTNGGNLEMPCLDINDETETFFRNLMALEQCHRRYQSETKICDYILFMDFLINTAKDVELLVGKEIIVNGLGDHKAVADLLNKLSLEIMVWKKSCFSECIRRLNKYYEVPYHSWKATLRHEYFKTPFRAASTIAAFILVVLTLLQTIFSGIAL